MGFQENFKKALHPNFTLSKSGSINNFLPVPVSVPADIEKNLPFIQAYAGIKALFPYYYEMSCLTSYCLLCTDSGTGFFTAKDLCYTLVPGTMVFLDCRKWHRIEIKQSPWHYKIFFMSGNPLPYLYLNYSSRRNILHTFPVGSPVPYRIEKLYEHLSHNKENYLLNSKFILDIILEITMEKEKTEGPKNLLPVYITEIKQNFDRNYGNKFTLGSLEQKYQVSRYQICREFTSCYGVSPIRYLNNIRIAAAKEALIHSDKRINEIGRMVSFENTNHFIRLFRQKTGLTPLAYRKAGLSAIFPE